MKIRMGFVSNSSSSSFCIYGQGIEIEEIKEIAKKLNVEMTEDDYIDTYGLDEELKKQGFLIRFQNMMGDSYWIGGSWDSIPDEMTGKEFKERIEKEINSLLIRTDQEFGTHEEAWRDG